VRPDSTLLLGDLLLIVLFPYWLQTITSPSRSASRISSQRSRRLSLLAAQVCMQAHLSLRMTLADSDLTRPSGLFAPSKSPRTLQLEPAQ
jgi:hypothetical protein